MAAAEYYNPGGRQPSPAVQPPRIQPPVQQQQQQQPPRPQQLPYPISDAPPPYTPFVDHSRPHSQPPPQNRVRFEDELRPILVNGKNSYHASSPRPLPPQNYASNEKLRPPPAGYGYPPTSHPAPQQYPPPQPNNYYAQGPPPPVNGPGYADPYAYRGPTLSPQPYYPQDRSRSRSHDRRHRHHHSHRHRDDPPQKKKGSGVNTFLGAGGGAIIGDAIFPGLGTLGGAILGGLGGHEYTKQRRSYSSSTRMGRRSYSSTEADYYEDDYGRGRKH